MVMGTALKADRSGNRLGFESSSLRAVSSLGVTGSSPVKETPINGRLQVWVAPQEGSNPSTRYTCTRGVMVAAQR